MRFDLLSGTIDLARLWPHDKEEKNKLWEPNIAPHTESQYESIILHLSLRSVNFLGLWLSRIFLHKRMNCLLYISGFMTLMYDTWDHSKLWVIFRPWHLHCHMLLRKQAEHHDWCWQYRVVWKASLRLYNYFDYDSKLVRLPRIESIFRPCFWSL